MSHFNVHVFTHDNPSEETLGELLAPYDENMTVAPYVEETLTARDVEEYREEYRQVPPQYPDLQFLEEIFGEGAVSPAGDDFEIVSTSNPNSKWDWWEIGGRWRGALHVPGGADIARVSAIDATEAMKKAAKGAEAEYTRFEEATAGLEIPPTWNEVLEGFRGDSAAARRLFNDNLWVKAARKCAGTFFLGDLHDLWKVGSGGREAFVRDAQYVDVPYAFIGLDGRWHEHGRMGWWGLSFDEMKMGEWAEKYRAYRDGVAADGWVANLDLHI